MASTNLATYRRMTQVAFILFIFLIPVLNILRIDSDTHELILFGASWSVGKGCALPEENCRNLMPAQTINT